MNFRFFILFLGFLAISVTATHAQTTPEQANYMKCVAKNETSGIDDVKAAKVQNQYGYTGIYQMGVNYAGPYVCSNNSSIPEMSKYQNWNVCVFAGSKMDKMFGIKSFADFTTGPNAVAAQNYIMQQNSNATWNRILKDPNMSKYIGKTINGVEMTKETMLAMAHLKGYGGLETTVKGGTSVDGNGTSTTSYAACLAACLKGGADASAACATSKGEDKYVDVCTDEKKEGTSVLDEDKKW